MREASLAPLRPDWVVVHTDQWRGTVSVTGTFLTREDAETWLTERGITGAVCPVQRTPEAWRREVGLPDTA